MARPIPLDTTVVRLDANNQIIHMITYGLDPFQVQNNRPVWVNAQKPDGTTLHMRYAELAGAGTGFAPTYTQIGLYNDGCIAFQRDATPLLNTSGQPIPSFVEKYYAPLGVGQDTTFGQGDFTFSRGVLSREITVTGAVKLDVQYSADGKIKSINLDDPFSAFDITASRNELTTTIDITRANGTHVFATNSNGQFNLEGLHAMLVAQGAGNVISNDGGSLISNDGGSISWSAVTASGLVSRARLLPEVVSKEGLALALNVKDSVSRIISEHGAGVISNDGASLISNDGGSLVAQGAGNLVSHDGGSVAPPPAVGVRYLQAFTGGNYADQQGQEYDAVIAVNPADDFTRKFNQAGTTGTIVDGGSATGNLETLGDTDWFTANLVAGQTYTIELKGAGTNDGELRDPVLWLWDNTFNSATGLQGNFITSNDEGGVEHNAKLVYTATYTGTHFLEARSYAFDADNNPSTPDIPVSTGTYKLTLTSGNQAPVFVSDGGQYLLNQITIAENQTFIGQLRGLDPQQGSTGLTYKIIGGPDADKFNIPFANTGTLEFKVAPDYDRPTDADANDPNQNNIYEVDVGVQDSGGLVGTQRLKVFITDVAEPSFADPSSASAMSVSIAENTTFESYVRATDPSNATLTYSLTGEDAALFRLVTPPNPAQTGKYLQFITTPNFENPKDAGHDNVYNVNVKATKPGGLFDLMPFTITVTDQADPKIIGVLPGQGADDNGTVRPFADAIVNLATSVKVSLSASANGTFTSASLSANGFTPTGTANEWIRTGGDLTTAVRGLVFDPTDNQVANGQFVLTTFTLTASDGTFTDQKTTTLSVKSVPDVPNTPPTIILPSNASSASLNFVENSTANVTTVQASDTEGGPITYSLVTDDPSALDHAKFTLGATSGVLSFISPPDFENPQGTTFGNSNTYVILVRATDNRGALDNQYLFINVTDVSEAVSNPTISNVPTSQALNDNGVVNPFASQSGLATVNNATSIKVTISNTANGTFAPQSLTGWTATGTPGQWTFSGTNASMSNALHALVFDPTNNQVVPGAQVTTTFSVEARDASNRTATTSTSVVVTSINDAPVITSNGGGLTATLMVAENTAAVTSVVATDQDVAATRSYSIVNGGDSAKFQINASTGAVAFITAPDFEAPTDADGNNSYIVQVRASDGSLSDTQTITVNVTDVADTVRRHHSINDFNPDNSDILFQRPDGTLLNFHMSGPDIASAAVSGRIGLEWQIASTGDYNGDHATDFFMRRADGSVLLLEMANNQVRSAAVIGPIGNEWQLAGSSDFNADGRDDILWQRDDGTLMVFNMSGPQITGATTIGQIGAEWDLQGTGDYNGDGSGDMLWRHADGSLLMYQVANNQVQSGAIVGQVGKEWQIAGSGDFNGDQNTHILWRRADGALMIFDMNGPQTASVTFPGQLGNEWNLEGTADYNSDGTADMLWHRADGALVLFEMANNQVANSTIFGHVGTEWHIL